MTPALCMSAKNKDSNLGLLAFHYIRAYFPRLVRGIDRSCAKQEYIAPIKIELDPANKSPDVET